MEACSFLFILIYYNKNKLIDVHTCTRTAKDKYSTY